MERYNRLCTERPGDVKEEVVIVVLVLVVVVVVGDEKKVYKIRTIL